MKILFQLFLHHTESESSYEKLSQLVADRQTREPQLYGKEWYFQVMLIFSRDRE